MAKKKKQSMDRGKTINNPFPGQDFVNDEGDGELLIIFMTEFRSLEQALIRAGFTKAGRAHGMAQPDWTRFVRHIEARFHPEASAELEGAVSYLLYDPEKMKARERQLLQGSRFGETSSAQSDILWLSELVQATGNKLTHGIPFLKKDDFDAAEIMAALLVVEAWSYCDPMIKSLLTHIK